MRKLISLIFLLIMSADFVSGGPVVPIDKKTIRNMNRDQRQARVSVLEDRLREIEALDLKALEKVKRKEIKKEVRDINREMKKHAISGGVYVSAGAIILIVILLILLL